MPNIEWGPRRSTWIRKKPTAYKPSHQNKTYTHEGVININVLEDQNMRKFTEIDQTYHVIGVALVEAHSLKKGLKLFGQDGKKYSPKRNATASRHGNLLPCRPSKLSYNDKKGPLGQWWILLGSKLGRSKQDSVRGGRAKEFSGL